MLAPTGATHKGSSRRAEWQRQLAAAAGDPVAIAAILPQGGSLAAVADAAGEFVFRATSYYLSLADPTDPNDPILRQVLPSADELAPSPEGYRDDAVGDLDADAHPAAGLVRKYAGRALLVTTGLCAVNCRFCFRRAFPYEETREGLAAALEVIEGDDSLSEIILSGGDPLTAPDGALRPLIERLASIPHIKRLRIHTRVPVVLPDRIDGALVALLRSTRLRPWVVAHFNHPRELARPAAVACRRLIEAGIPVLNQGVLLRGVNDDVNVLEALHEGLVDLGVKPYYLHQLDRVTGVSHFEVPEEEGRALVEALRVRVSGIAMPTWVRDIPGEPAKRPL
ncbi:MAG: KamA family radical SAM protein [Proteobacteria bacterium]|nr:KamA family radical SAM protein [Pseudomonadota bacterium]